MRTAEVGAFGRKELLPAGVRGPFAACKLDRVAGDKLILSVGAVLFGDPEKPVYSVHPHFLLLET